ncbi:ABC transporter permease [Streptococcus porcinus]|uniref:ABC-2 type transporter n=2 Tax=Streptococcus porcinus TaxID=1340 RepID=A0A4V0GY82_STRPO|nr:ABC transporter permease [Streptococcus porcinus]EGJ28252.1 ABC-2 type transporter [Streptococcus porcinus str. Jelinkova 176]SQG42548.1 ABC-2 type transporter [Streptococcus porcinus]VTT41591.1 ABC-2 type transporter [Streptococcus porcinus]VTT42591.1 ABC-2 type transporter [Streptococcus porcinus]
MKALLKIEWIKLWREWPTFILAIGMPVGFFLFYSGMTMSPDPKLQKEFIQSYMLTMTAFSMSSFGFFSFPSMLFEDRKNHWLLYLEHANVNMLQYYLSKIVRVYISFTCSILATFMIAKMFRGVEMSLEQWLGSTILLLISGLVFLAMGLLIAQIPSPQLMSIVGNVVFLLLAIIGGSWMPISVFPKWMQYISKLTPTYHVNQMVTKFAEKTQLKWQSLLIVFAYAIIMMIIALVIKQRREVSV